MLYLAFFVPGYYSLCALQLPHYFDLFNKSFMVERGFDFYNNKGLGTVPVSVVAEILGLEELHVKN